MKVGAVTAVCVVATVITLVTPFVWANAASFTPPISVQLRSPWSAPPLLLEILEAAYEEEPSSFFTLLSHLTSPWALSGIIKNEDLDSNKTIGKVLQQSTDQRIYNAARRILDERQLLNHRGQRDNFEFSLALRSQAPKIAAFWQLYNTTSLQQRWEKAKKQDDCGSWVDFAEKALCSEEELIKELESYSGDVYLINPSIVPFDHIFSLSGQQSSSLPTAVLYADPFSDNFWSLHKCLTEYALGSRQNGQALQYILRWKPISQFTNNNDSYLAGYGAFLDLKKVDYLVIDDRKLTDTAVVQAGDKESASIETKESRQILEEDQRWMEKLLKMTSEDKKQSIGSLSTEELANLSQKAAYTILKSKNPLRSLRLLSQDFPKYGVGLAKSSSQPSKSFLKELADLQESKMQGGANGVFLNGKSMTFKEFQPINLLSALRSERAIINALTALHLSTPDAVALLTSPAVTEAYAAKESKVALFDSSDRIEMANSGMEGQPGDVITYWNDLEKQGDVRYARWPTELRSILRPMYPGSFPVIRRNLFNIILVLDLEKVESCKFLSDTVHMTVNRIAIRWGFVPSNIKDESGPSLHLARLFWIAIDKGGIDVAAKYLRRVTAASSTDKIEVKIAERELLKILKLSNDELNGLLFQYKDKEDRTRFYIQRLRADEAGQGHAFLNGQHMPFGPQTFQFIHQAIATQVQIIAPEIYYGTLSEDADVSTYFYDLPGTYSSRSELLFPSEESNIKTRAVEIDESSLAKDSFVYPSSDKVEMTVWVAGNLDSRQGAKLIKDVAYILEKANARLGFLHNPSRKSSSKQPSLLLSTFLYQLLLSSSKKISPNQLVEMLKEYEGEMNNLQDAKGIEQVVLGHSTASINYIKAQGWNLPESGESEQYWSHNDRLFKELNLGEQDFALIVNGKVVSNFSPDNLSSADYLAFLQQEKTKMESVMELMINMTTVDVNLATRVSSILEKAFFVDTSLEGIFEAPSTARNMIVDQIEFKETTFSIGNKETASLWFSVLLDPLTETAQLWSSVLEMLAGFEDVYVKVIMNPTTILTELPIKRYYRYSAPHKLTFDNQGYSKGELLPFHEMPMDAVLTMGLDAPPSWLTMAAAAIYDLDNIRLKDVVTPTVSIIYDLKYILIEGHARDELTRSVPRGLQIVLETMDGSEQLDTIVMANLGYFQFRAKPGLYRLRLRHGRGSELFDMISVGNAGYDSPPVEITGESITLSTLQGLTIYPRMVRKKGKEKEILVEEEESNSVVIQGASTAEDGDSASILSRAKSLLNSLKEKEADVQGLEKDVQKQATINVFTVASGHLYERMTYIMILSTIKHTSSTVKFWFIENFLSPSFKDFIPHLAQEYGFEYELITYAWPHWLRPQKEKQRSIWGMKVLFLDVIFPLSLGKVIFVDADQIVRADLKELIDVDLKGAPYGFPPMGNDSFDMDNFRFWEQPGGYWEKFLRGKPYPISALFVVDLNKFRLQAAGDKLRGNYQALTQDPGSLSNLDQDLVASMIHVVKIHSLEKEWLWCETWCSWDWYDKAKSIDLCSNPKTKEPKLDRAKRQIPEWTEYDNEVARVAMKFKEQGKLGANVVAPAESQSKVSIPSPPPSSSTEEKHLLSHDEL